MVQLQFRRVDLATLGTRAGTTVSLYTLRIWQVGFYTSCVIALLAKQSWARHKALQLEVD